MLKICLTGGPCAGKSSAYAILERTLSARGYKVLFCPESASELILNGIVPGVDISLINFQELVLDKQINKENLYNEAEKLYDFDTSKIIIFYDRGILDQLAYIEKTVFYNMLNKRNLTLSDVYNRYDAVLHLVTAADGAIEHYVWNDPSKESVGNNAARSETPEEAIIKDKKTLNSWIGHPHLRVFDNKKDFNSKINDVLSEVYSLLGEPVPKEIERKYLIKKPSKEQIEALGYLSETNIIQTYLKRTDEKVERRIRQRGSVKEGYSFYYTEKTDISLGERIEVERKITPTEYISYLEEADTSLHQISKVRYCFIYGSKKQYFELDIYPFSEEYAILEIELSDINEEIMLPPLDIVKDITNELAYRNNNIAKNMQLKEELK